MSQSKQENLYQEAFALLLRAKELLQQMETACIEQQLFKEQQKEAA